MRAHFSLLRRSRFRKPLPGLLRLLAATALSGNASAIESFSEPDTVIVGQVFNTASFPAHVLTQGTVSWTLGGPAGEGGNATFEAEITRWPDGNYYFRVTIPHQAVLGSFSLNEDSLPLAPGGGRSYSHQSIEVNGALAKIREGETGISLSQSSRGIVQRIDLETEIDPTDSDGDGMPDWWEELYGLDSERRDGHENGDGDDLTNLEEFELGTNPNVSDSMFERTSEIDPDEEQFFKFTIEKPQIVTAYTTGPLDTVGVLLNGQRRGISNPAEDDDARGDGKNFEIQEGLLPGQYWVKVSSRAGAGTFQLQIEQGDGYFVPDLRSGKKPNAASHGGDNAYSYQLPVSGATPPPGSYGANQRTRLTGSLKRGVKAFLSIENDGDFPDTTVTTLSGLPRKKFLTKFTSPGVGNVTASIVGAGYPSVKPPGAIEVVIGRIKPKGRKRRGTIRASTLSTLQQLVDQNQILIKFR